MSAAFVSRWWIACGLVALLASPAIVAQALAQADKGTAALSQPAQVPGVAVAALLKGIKLDGKVKVPILVRQLKEVTVS